MFPESMKLKVYTIFLNLPQLEENQEVFEWNHQCKEIAVAHCIG